MVLEGGNRPDLLELTEESIMNPKAQAYLTRYATLVKLADGREELVLPIDRVQGFLDLLNPGDVPPDKVQRLYLAQDQLITEVRRQLDPGSAESES